MTAILIVVSIGTVILSPVPSFPALNAGGAIVDQTHLLLRVSAGIPAGVLRVQGDLALTGLAADRNLWR